MTLQTNILMKITCLSFIFSRVFFITFLSVFFVLSPAWSQKNRSINTGKAVRSSIANTRAVKARTTVQKKKPAKLKKSKGTSDEKETKTGKNPDEEKKKTAFEKNLNSILDKNPGDEDSPWSKVDVPQEVKAGIEYKKPRRGARFSFNLVDADLMELVKIIGNITGKSFIIGGKAKSLKATIYAPTRITADEAYQAFLSVLQVNGLTVTPSGRYLKIVQVTGATARNTPFFKRRVPGTEQIVSTIYHLKNISPDDLKDILNRFKSAEGDVTIYWPTNMLIITDYGHMIKRLVRLIGLLDVPGTGEEIWIEPINYADAAEIADKIMEIFEVDKSTKKKSKKRKKTKGKSVAVADQGTDNELGGMKISKIIPDERTNSIIIVSSEEAYFRILELIKKLDIIIAGEGTLHVHKLQHADATELSKTLNDLTKSSKRNSKSTKSKKGGSEGLFESEIELSADKATNSLVIVASLRDYLRIKEVIEKLDVMQRQVFVEAVIMEVSLDKNRDFGLGIHGGKDVDFGDGKKGLIFTSSQPSSKISSLGISPGMLSGLAAGLTGPEIAGSEDLIGLSIPAFGIALQALQTNSDVNVLSTPHILATDNEDATITVGENVPMQQGFNPGGAMMGNLMNQAMGSSSSNMAGLMGGMGGYGMGMSIGRQNVGLTLKITPHINDDDQVKIDIDLEISEVKSVTSMGPNISKQNAVTTSIVKDQQTIVIGGLITDNQVETTKKVPILGDIPIIGALFRHKSTLTKKRNLLIFLTPYIIRDSDDFKEIFNRKMAERREFIERYTAFEHRRYDPHIDWSRTNGIMAEINSVVSRAEENERLKKQSVIDTSVKHNPKEPIQFVHPSNSLSDYDESPIDNQVPALESE